MGPRAVLFIETGLPTLTSYNTLAEAHQAADAAARQGKTVHLFEPSRTYTPGEPRVGYPAFSVEDR